MQTDHTHSIWTRSIRALFPLIMALAAIQGASADGATPLFSDSSLIEATIEAPFDKLMYSRNQDEELEAVLKYKDPASDTEQQFEIKIRVRGNFRARKDICHFAPLRLNFKKKQVKGTLFAGQDKLKLVTHCENSDTEYEQYVLKEYMTYRFLQTITDNSYRTRLLKISYVDSNGDSRTRTRFAFLIEHKEQLAERLKAKIIEVESIEFNQLDYDQANVVTVFAYFAGNTDFSAIRGPAEKHCCHNVSLFEQRPGYILAVPYDFDLAGMVDAPYAEPNPRHGIRKVTDRLYRGLCRNNERLPNTFQQFQEKRDAIYAIVNEVDGLRHKQKKRMESFIDDFYKVIEKDSLVEREFIKKCY